MQMRREPPGFRRAAVARTEAVSPRLRRVTLAGSELEGLELGLPAASVRLLLPRDGELVLPTWNGNEFRHEDGERPTIRTLTPVALRAGGPELDVEVVVHDGGTLARWATAARPGAEVAVSGTGRGYEIDEEAPAFLIVGDESALPAIGVLLAQLPAAAEVQVLVELAAPEGRIGLAARPRVRFEWLDLPRRAAPGDALLAAVAAAPLPDGVRVWGAGEAAAMQRLRRHLFDERGLPRSHGTIRGYWKRGRAGD